MVDELQKIYSTHVFVARQVEFTDKYCNCSTVFRECAPLLINPVGQKQPFNNCTELPQFLGVVILL